MYLSGQFSVFRLFSVFDWSQSIGERLMTPVFFVKTTESCEVSLLLQKK